MSVSPLAPFSRALRPRALRLLAQREYSRSELRRKLAAQLQRNQQRESRQGRIAALGTCADTPDVAERDTEADPARRAADIEALLDWLEANRYLSDARFVESRVNARSARFGNTRIRLELAKHQTALSPDTDLQLRESEFDRARTVWARKFEVAAADAAGRARQARFLAGRGFGAEVISRVLRAAGRASQAPPDPADAD